MTTNSHTDPLSAEARATRNGHLLDPYDHLHYAITTAGVLFDCLSVLQDADVDPGHLVRLASIGQQWCQKAVAEARRLYEAGKQWQEGAEQQLQ
jgi:hypothetical protein